MAACLHAIGSEGTEVARGVESQRVFGTWRYFLALLVVWGHAVPFVDGVWNWSGVYAVWGFFTLSGYLMTRVLHETYGFGLSGQPRYLANRMLRIYPPYWVALGFAAIVILAIPETARRLSGSHAVLPDARGWLLNIGLLGLSSNESPRLISPAWSLHVELVFYLAMGALLSRSRWIILGWLAASVCIAAWFVAHGAGLDQRYASVLGASLPFSAGAAVYLLSRRYRPGAVYGPLLVMLFALHVVHAKSLWGDPRGWALYAVVPLCASITLVLSGLRVARLAALDRWLGELSYPIFLIHPPVCLLLSHIAYGGARLRGPEFFWACLIPVHVLALALYLAVEGPVERLRDRVRGFSRSRVRDRGDRP